MLPGLALFPSTGTFSSQTLFHCLCLFVDLSSEAKNGAVRRPGKTARPLWSLASDNCLWAHCCLVPFRHGQQASCVEWKLMTFRLEGKVNHPTDPLSSIQFPSPRIVLFKQIMDLFILARVILQLSLGRPENCMSVRSPRTRPWCFLIRN